MFSFLLNFFKVNSYQINMNLFDFGKILWSRPMFELWCKDNNLLPHRVNCPECQEEMRLITGKPVFICSLKTRHRGRKLVRVSQYKGTIFEGARASPELIMEIVQCFSLKLTYDQTVAQTSASRTTISKWFNICRSVCLETMR